MMEIKLDMSMSYADNIKSIKEYIEREESEIAEVNSKIEYESHGFKCRIIRQSTGHLCGYIEQHLEFDNHDYFGAEDFYAVYGGVTFVEDGVIGFDTYHAFDVAPYVEHSVIGYQRREDYNKISYKTLNFVKNEVEKLALQASAYKIAIGWNRNDLERYVKSDIELINNLINRELKDDDFSYRDVVKFILVKLERRKRALESDELYKLEKENER